MSRRCTEVAYADRHGLLDYLPYLWSPRALQVEDHLAVAGDHQGEAHRGRAEAAGRAPLFDNHAHAECADGGAGLLVEVRCDQRNTLQRGERALIVSFDDAREAYVVEPI